MEEACVGPLLPPGVDGGGGDHHHHGGGRHRGGVGGAGDRGSKAVGKLITKISQISQSDLAGLKKPSTPSKKTVQRLCFTFSNFAFRVALLLAVASAKKKKNREFDLSAFPTDLKKVEEEAEELTLIFWHISRFPGNEKETFDLRRGGGKGGTSQKRPFSS